MWNECKCGAECVCMHSACMLCQSLRVRVCVRACILGWSYKCRGSKLVYTGEGARERERNSEKARKTESGGSLGVNGATWLRSVVGQPVVLFLSLSLSLPLCLSLLSSLSLACTCLLRPGIVPLWKRLTDAEWGSQPPPSLPCHSLQC